MVMDTTKEMRIQIALGTLPTAPGVLSKIIKRTDSIELLLWALKHSHAKVRAAAVVNPLLPPYEFVYASLSDTTTAVREASQKSMTRRGEEIEKFLSLLQTVHTTEQLEFDFEYPDNEESKTRERMRRMQEEACDIL